METIGTTYSVSLPGLVQYDNSEKTYIRTQVYIIIIIYYVLDCNINSSPTAGLDYSTVLNPSTLTFGAGSIIGDTACFDVSLLTDTVVEGQEFFFLSLTSSDGLVTINSGQSRATVNINDLTRKLF